jgi:hypothetical protein
VPLTTSSPTNVPVAVITTSNVADTCIRQPEAGATVTVAPMMSAAAAEAIVVSVVQRISGSSHGEIRERTEKY